MEMQMLYVQYPKQPSWSLGWILQRPLVISLASSFFLGSSFSCPIVFCRQLCHFTSPLLLVIRTTVPNLVLRHLVPKLSLQHLTDLPIRSFDSSNPSCSPPIFWKYSFITPLLCAKPYRDTSKYSVQELPSSQAPVAHAYNPSYSGGRDQKDRSLKPARADSWKDPISKLPNAEKGWWSGSSGRMPA
jgi:hypothetical protein